MQHRRAARGPVHFGGHAPHLGIFLNERGVLFLLDEINGGFKIPMLDHLFEDRLPPDSPWSSGHPFAK